MTDQQKLLSQLAELARRNHYTCEDTWYNCPQSEGGSANDDAGAECDCGADEHNAKVDAICTALSQPEPEGLTDEEMKTDFLCWYKDRYSTAYFGAVPLVVLIAWTQFALARWGRPAVEPVPVSERLPGPEDCDAEGRCWWWDDDDDKWCLHEHSPRILCWTHWLPHYALPVPTTQENN